MRDQIAVAAEQFVDCVRDTQKDPTKEAAVFFKVVAMAGFEPSRIVPGRIIGDYLEQDGSRTGETYLVNTTNPHKVVGQNGRDHYHATGWLDSMVRIAAKIRDREECIDRVKREIERSIPLDPIQLTTEGDGLEECHPSIDTEYLVDHTRDTDAIRMTAGVHAFCNGYFDRVEISKTHNALVCRKCHLRVPFPKTVTTYGALRGTLVLQRGQQKGGAENGRDGSVAKGTVR